MNRRDRLPFGAVAVSNAAFPALAKAPRTIYSDLALVRCRPHQQRRLQTNEAHHWSEIKLDTSGCSNAKNSMIEALANRLTTF